MIGEQSPVDLPPETEKERFTDETFPPESGRCAEVAAGDPLRTPSADEVESALANHTTAEIQTHVGTWYEGYVDTYRSDYEAAKAAGNLEDANESYVRYLLAGPGLPVTQY